MMPNRRRNSDVVEASNVGRTVHAVDAALVGSKGGSSPHGEPKLIVRPQLVFGGARVDHASEDGIGGPSHHRRRDVERQDHGVETFAVGKRVCAASMCFVMIAARDGRLRDERALRAHGAGDLSEFDRTDDRAEPIRRQIAARKIRRVGDAGATAVAWHRARFGRSVRRSVRAARRGRLARRCIPVSWRRRVLAVRTRERSARDRQRERRERELKEGTPTHRSVVPHYFRARASRFRDANRPQTRADSAAPRA